MFGKFGRNLKSGLTKLAMAGALVVGAAQTAQALTIQSVSDFIVVQQGACSEEFPAILGANLSDPVNPFQTNDSGTIYHQQDYVTLYVTDPNNVVIGFGVFLVSVSTSSSSLDRDISWWVRRAPSSAGNWTLHIVDATTTAQQYAYGEQFGGSGRSESFDGAALLPACAVPAPTIDSITRKTPTGQTTNADSLVFNMTFSEAVQNVGSADFTVTGGSTASVTNVSAVSSSSYDITVSGGDLASYSGTVGLGLASGQDIESTSSEAIDTDLPAGAQSYALDNTAPTATLSLDIMFATASFFTLQFSEPISGLLPSDISIVNGSIFSGPGSRDDTSFVFIVETSVNASFSVSLPAGVVQDAAGNVNTASNTFMHGDLAPPTVALSTTTSSPNSGNFLVDVTFSEEVTGFTQSDLTLGNATASNFATLDNINWTFDAVPVAEGAVTVDIGAGVATDTAGNQNTAATQLMVVSDQTKPTVALTAPFGSVVGGLFGVNVTFSEVVSGLTASDLVLGNAKIGSFTTDDNKSWSFTLAAISDGQVTIDLAANAVTDAAGNPNTAATQLTLTSDTTRPTAAISTTSGTTVAGSFPVTVQFSETVTGFDSGDVTVGNGTLSSFATSDNTVFTFTVTPASDGAVTVDVAAGVAADAASNSNSAATQLSVTSDSTKPTVTSITRGFDGSTQIPATTDKDIVSWFVAFSEDVARPKASDFSVSGTTADISISEVSASTYEVSISGGDLANLNALVTLSFAGGQSIVDLAGNALSNTTPSGTNNATFTLLNDTTPPTVTITSTASSPVSGAFSVNFNFSEAVSGFEATDVTVSNGVLSNFATSSSSAYSATITPSADGAVTVDVAGSVAVDGAGNGNTAATQFAITSDSTKPTVELTSKVSTIHSGAFTVLATFSEDVTGFEQADVSITNGVISAFTGSNDSYSFTVTPSADGTVTVGVAAGVAADSAGNVNTASTDFQVTADGTKPSVTIASKASAPHSGAFVISVTFSEVVTGFDASDITVGNGVLSDFAGSGASYSVTVTPSSDGAVTVDIAADVAIDQATNGNTAATQFSLTTDGTAPVVTLSGPTDTQTGDFTISVSVSEDVTGLALDDFDVTNGSVSNLTGSGDSYQVTASPVLGEEFGIFVKADAVEDGAGNANAASANLSVETGTPATQFEEETEQVQGTLGEEGQRNLKNDFAATGRFIDLALGDFMADRGPNALPGGGANIGGNANVTVSGKNVVTDGFFTRSDEYAGGRKRYVLGQFDLARSTDGSTTGQFSARYGWEFEASDDLSVGYFIGAGVSRAEIKGSYAGEVNSVSALAGLYAMERLDDDLFITAYGAMGYTQAELDATSGSLALDGTYGSTNYYLGAQLIGRFTQNDVEYRPSVAVDYGMAQVGVAGFDATAFGVTQPVTHDFGNVIVWNFSLAQEAIFTLGDRGENGTLGVAPSLECQQETNATDTTRLCGYGLGFEYRSANNRTTLGAEYRNIQGNEQLSLRALYELEF